MSFSKNDSKGLVKIASDNGYKTSSFGNSLVKADGSMIKPSSTGGSWNVNGHNYSSFSDAKKSGRI